MNPHEKIAAIKSAAEAGDGAAQCQLAHAYEVGEGIAKDDVQAANWYFKSAAQGHARAQFCMGWFCAHGRGLAKDPTEAARYYQLAAENGDPLAPYYLAEMYANGSGIPKDDGQAVRWYRVAADRGHADGQFQLAWMYRNGRGITQDDKEAVRWYRKAAEQGNAAAENNLGWMYENGKGVPQDRAEAIRWYRRAAKRDSKTAQENLERLHVPLEEPVVAPAAANKSHNREPHARSRESTECKPLLSACTPLVYVHNAFRITGLPVDASAREIKRRIDDLKAAAEMGDDEDEHTHAFALKPSPTVDHIREAAQRLQDPERRIIEEFFWFWPQDWGKGSSDTALLALRNGDKDAAFKLWSEAIEVDEESASIIAKHNLAVMYQMVALDSEILALKIDLSAQQAATVAKYWTTCFNWWEELTEDETFWSLVADRIRMLDDERLTTGFARRMRSTFPVALDRINALLAIQYAEKGKYDDAKKHVAYMNQTHQGADDVDQVISDILKPLETRINNAVEKAVARARQDATKGADIAKELLETTKQPLAIARSMLDESHAVRSYLFEHVSDACFTCLIAYGNKTEDWPACIALLKLTEPLVVTAEAREKIRSNIAQAEKNHQEKVLYEMCWFCKRAKAEIAHVLEVPMHGDVNREWQLGGTRLTWRTLTAKVPRCGACKEAHSKVAGTWTGAAAGAAIGTAILPVIGSAIGLFAGGAIGKLVDKKMRLPNGVAAETAKASYPPIKKLLSEGWAFGEKPSS